MALFLKYGDIKGSATSDGFKDQIEIESFQFGVGRGVGAAKGGNRETSVASVSEITLSKAQDASSIKLFEEALLGKGGDALLTLTVTSGDTNAKKLELEMKDAIVSGYSISSGGDRPQESISLNFASINYTFHGKDEKQADTQFVYGYNLVTEKKL